MQVRINEILIIEDGYSFIAETLHYVHILDMNFHYNQAKIILERR